jgi:hypothetical protein
MTMRDFSRYRLHADALMQISRKFRELSEVDYVNADLLEECAANLTAVAEALVTDSCDIDAYPAVLH